MRTLQASKYPIATAITAAFTAATAFLSAHADKRIRLVLVESDDILIGEFKRVNRDALTNSLILTHTNFHSHSDSL